MKKILLSLFIFFILLSTASADKNKTVSTKIGEKADEVPCTCVFNKNRMWNPEKIVWNNEEWECAIYKNDGTCSAVQVIKIAKDKNISIKTAEKVDEDPCTCLFNNNRMWNPEQIIWNNEEWECANYKDDGTCSAVQLVKMNKDKKTSTKGKLDNYLIADSAVRLLSKNELLVNNSTELRLMRNEIFARHGYIFKSKDLKQYFSQRSWYKPDSTNVSLSSVEAQNVRLIKALESNKMTDQDFQYCMELSSDLNQAEIYFLDNSVDILRLESEYRVIIVERMNRDKNKTPVDREIAEQELHKLEIINNELESAKDSAPGYKRKIEKIKSKYKSTCTEKIIPVAFKEKFCSTFIALRDPFCKEQFKR